MCVPPQAEGAGWLAPRSPRVTLQLWQPCYSSLDHYTAEKLMYCCTAAGQACGCAGGSHGGCDAHERQGGWQVCGCHDCAAGIRSNCVGTTQLCMKPPPFNRFADWRSMLHLKLLLALHHFNPFPRGRAIHCIPLACTSYAVRTHPAFLLPFLALHFLTPSHYLHQH